MDDKITIAYIRVSTGKQAEEGMSLDAQRAKLTGLAVARGVVLAEVIVDSESAKDLNRPGMIRLIEMVKAKRVSAVLIAKLDRITRSVRDLWTLVDLFNKYDVALVSPAESLDTGTAMGRMVMSLIASIAQWERETIGERTKEVLQQMKKSGWRVGTVPYGYMVADDERALIREPGEQAVLGLIRAWYQAGKSLREIADLLNSHNHRTRRGTPWRHQYVQNLLHG